MNTPNFFNNDWMNTQREYWENINKMTQSMMDQPPKENFNPWHESINQFWTMFKPQAPDNIQSVMENLMNQGKAMHQFAEPFLKTGGSKKDLFSQMVDGFQEWQKKLEESSGGLFESNHLSPMMQSPVEFWNKFTDGTAFKPMTEAFNMEQFNPAALGYQREKQEKVQKLFQLQGRYMQTMQEYQKFFIEITPESIERFKENYEDQQLNNRAPETFRELYNLWISSSEEVHSEQVMTPKYLKLHGKLVNQLMLVKQQWNALSDDMLQQFNIPTRKDLDGALKQQVVLKRENRRLKQQINELSGLASEVEALKKSFAELENQNSVDIPSQSSAVVKKAPLKKRAPRSTKKPAVSPSTTQSSSK